MHPEFETHTAPSRLTVFDPIEKRRFSLVTPRPVSAAHADPDQFYFPVSVARSIQTSEIELPYTVSVYVRDADGSMLEEVEPPVEVSLPRDQYLVELSAPVKLYLRVETELAVEADHESVRLSFDPETTVLVGARSRHESPAATITVPDDPTEMMAGLSVLSSSLKTTSPERSFPTLRGHPPRVELGDGLSIPDGISRPDAGVTIEVPPTYEKLYPVVPLAFYLCADVVPGDVPRLLTDTGFEHRLDSDHGYEREVERVLKQTFLLDCVVRTEGYYPIRLAERTEVESRLDFEVGDPYDRPLAERIEQYLDVPYATIADAVPRWHRVTFTRPNAETVELLPHVVDDLSLIRTPPDPKTGAFAEESGELWDAIADFQRESRDSPERVVRGRPRNELGRARTEAEVTRTGQRELVPEREYVSVPETETVETAWAGDGTPTRGTKLVPSAYDRERPLPDDHVIDVTVVCNDSRMRREWNTVAEVYGRRDDVAIETEVEFGVGAERLRELLCEPTDLFHYIGHVEDAGFDCLDGFLDATTLEDAGMNAFLLNACNSQSQGEALVEAGASAGIVSLSEIGNSGAIEFGEQMARLFNYGFSVGSALALARDYTAIGSRYVGIGDVGLTLAQTENQIPVLYELLDCSETEVTLEAYAYTTQNYPLGSFSVLYMEDESNHYLNSGSLATIDVPKTRFEEMVDGFSTPVVVDGELRWTDDWSLDAT